MSVIKNDDNIKSKGTKSKAVYELPAVVRREKNEISFEKALIISLILHPAVLIIILLTSLVLKFLGIDFDLLKKPDLKPVMSLKARIVNIHEARDGEGISYGHTFTAHGNRKIATVPLGYADGVPRGLSNKISGSLNGKDVPQVGNITMDQMMFDITGVDAKLGDVVTLLDEKHSIDNWAKILGTINYELTCRLKVRLPRVYTR